MTEIGIWMRLVLAVLATWRVTHLLVSEDGPADMIVRFRALLGQSLAGRLMDCFNCLSLWIAACGAVRLPPRRGRCRQQDLAISKLSLPGLRLRRDV